MAEQIHGHMPPALDIEAVLADPDGACPDCIRLVIGQLTDALRLAESDGDSARRDLTGAYKALIGVMPGSRPASATAAASTAAKMIRDHEAERRRVLDERDAARAERDEARDLAVQAGESRADEIVRATNAEAALDATRAQMRHVRAELLAEESRMLDARVHVNPRAKKQLDAAARRLRALATSLDGENHA